MWRNEGGLLSSLPDDVLLSIFTLSPLRVLGRLARSCKRLRLFIYSDSLWRALRSSAKWALTCASSSFDDVEWDRSSKAAERFASVRHLVRHEVELERRWRTNRGRVATLPLQRCSPHEKIIEAACASLSFDGEWIVVTGERPPMLQVWRAAVPHVLTHSVRGRPFDRFNCRLLPAAAGSEYWRAVSTDRRKSKGSLYIWEVRPKQGRAADGSALRRVRAAQVEEAESAHAKAMTKPRVLSGHRTRLSGAALDVGSMLLATADEQGRMCVWSLANEVPQVIGGYHMNASLESIAMGRLELCNGLTGKSSGVGGGGGGGAGAPLESLAEHRVACGDFESRREHRIVIACGARDGVIRLLHVTAVTSHGHVVKEEEAEEKAERGRRLVTAAASASASAGDRSSDVACEGEPLQSASEAMCSPSSTSTATEEPSLPPLSVGRELRLEGHSDWVTHLELHGVRGPDDEGKRGAKPGGKEEVEVEAGKTPMHMNQAEDEGSFRSLARSPPRSPPRRARHGLRSPQQPHARSFGAASASASRGSNGSVSTQNAASVERRRASSSDDHELRLLLSGSRDHTVRTWSLQPGAAYATPLHVLSGHSRWINRVTLGCVRGEQSIDQRRFVVSASADSTLRVWRLADGKPLGTLKGHRLQVTDFDLCGTRLVSTSLDGTIRAWELRPLVEDAPPLLQSADLTGKAPPTADLSMPPASPTLPAPAASPALPAASPAVHVEAATSEASETAQGTDQEGTEEGTASNWLTSAKTERVVEEIMCIDESAMEHAGPVRFVSFDRERIVSCGDEGRVCVIGFCSDDQNAPAATAEREAATSTEDEE